MMRGYLHGGLFIDFVGEKAPVSVFKLLALDVIILFMDMIMLSLVIERIKMTGDNNVSTTPNTTAPNETGTSGQGQDHDMEERGVSAGPVSGNAAAPSPSVAADVTESDSNRPAPDGTQSAEDDMDSTITDTESETESDAESQGAMNSHALDVFASGEAVIMDTGLVDVVRDQWLYKPSSQPRRGAYLPSTEAANFLRQRFGLQISPDGLVVRVER